MERKELPPKVEIDSIPDEQKERYWNTIWQNPQVPFPFSFLFVSFFSLFFLSFLSQNITSTYLSSQTADGGMEDVAGEE